MTIPMHSAPFRCEATATLAATVASANIALPRLGKSQTAILTAPSTNGGIAFFRVGAGAGLAATAADMPLLPGTVQSYQVVESDDRLAAIMSAGAGTVYCSLGDGGH